MPKFIMSMGDETFRILASEAEKRNVKIQELLRTVIVPEWVKSNLDTRIMPARQREVESQITRPTPYRIEREPVLQSSMDRSKRQLAGYLWPSPPKAD